MEIIIAMDVANNDGEDARFSVAVFAADEYHLAVAKLDEPGVDFENAEVVAGDIDGLDTLLYVDLRIAIKEILKRYHERANV